LRTSSERLGERRLRLTVFIVQESVHGDYLSSHEAREEAVSMIEDLIREGLAKPGDFNIREIDEQGTIVRVFDPTAAAEAAR
jgi:hypothetical protein